MTPSLIQTWGHLDSLGCKQVTIWDLMHRRRTFGHPKLRKKKHGFSPSKKSPQKLESEMRWGVVGSMGLLPTKVESEGYNSSLEQWKKERNCGWIVDYTSYEILSFDFLEVWAASGLFLLLFYSNLGESTDQAMGGFKHFLIHHDPWVKMLQFDTRFHILPNWMSQAPIIDVGSRFSQQASTFKHRDPLSNRHPGADSLGIPNGKSCISAVPWTFPSWQSLPRPAHLSIFAWKHWTYLPRFPGSQTFRGKKRHPKKSRKKNKVEKSCLRWPTFCV